MIYILFALAFNKPAGFQQEFNSQGACIMALSEGERQSIFIDGFCSPKG